MICSSFWLSCLVDFSVDSHVLNVCNYNFSSAGLFFVVLLRLLTAGVVLMFPKERCCTMALFRRFLHSGESACV